MIVKLNNNIVDYKFQGYCFFFKTLQIHPFFMLVYVKKKKKENMQHMTSGTHTINRSHQSCVDVTPPGPHHHTERVSSAGGGHSNKERQRLQPLASVARVPLFEVRRVSYILSKEI